MVSVTSSPFSALQRAENSSILSTISTPLPARSHFQCSSASRKFLNLQRVAQHLAALRAFSALQRAENSSIVALDIQQTPAYAFQCSSASRKFLNLNERDVRWAILDFQCSSASRKFLNRLRHRVAGEERQRFQCSSASRKFLNGDDTSKFTIIEITFQCSSASRKFLNWARFGVNQSPLPSFSALQRAENSSIVRTRRKEKQIDLSVLFSEPKIPQCPDARRPRGLACGFQCSSASRKFLNRLLHPTLAHRLAPFSALQRAENSSIAP